MKLLTIKYIAPEKIQISWNNNQLDIRPNYKIRVLSCSRMFGPYQPITEWFDAYKTESITVNCPETKYTKDWCFKLEVKDNNDNIKAIPSRWGISISEPVTGTCRILASDAEIRYKIHGTAVIYYPIPSLGSRCPKCYDTVTQSILDSNCSSCYGSTFAGGYLNPAIVWIMIESPTEQSLTGIQTQQPIIANRCRVRLPWFTFARIGDIFIDYKQQVWRITDINKITSKEQVIYYIATAILLPKNSIQYQLQTTSLLIPSNWKYVPEFMK